MSEIVFSQKYLPLFEILQGEHPEVDTVLLTGGRGSAKSFLTSIFSLTALVDFQWDVLYTRFTNVSITDSIKPEVDDKIDLLCLENKVISTNTHIQNFLGNRIAFKGIKTGSKQQTANLKSLSGFNCFIVDEAEEMPDYDTYEKVFLSIRSNEKRNLTILILNPTSIHHWIFREFYQDREVDGGSNLIKDNVLYIHTSYLDVPREYLAPNIVAYYERLKETDEKKYNEIVLGAWTEATEDRVYNNWIRIPLDEFRKFTHPEIYCLDWGKNHKFAIVHQKYDAYGNNLYNHELNWKSENEILDEMTPQLRKKINESEGGVIVYLLTKLNIPKDAILVCDSARPDLIIMIRRAGWEYAYGVKKPKGSVMSGITLLHGTNVYYTNESKGIDHEFKNYQYNKDRLGVVDDEVVKKNDDLMDAIRYGRKHWGEE